MAPPQLHGGPLRDTPRCFDAAAVLCTAQGPPDLARAVLRRCGSALVALHPMPPLFCAVRAPDACTAWRARENRSRAGAGAWRAGAGCGPCPSRRGCRTRPCRLRAGSRARRPARAGRAPGARRRTTPAAARVRHASRCDARLVLSELLLPLLAHGFVGGAPPVRGCRPCHRRPGCLHRAVEHLRVAACLPAWCSLCLLKRCRVHESGAHLDVAQARGEGTSRRRRRDWRSVNLSRCRPGSALLSACRSFGLWWLSLLRFAPRRTHRATMQREKARPRCVPGVRILTITGLKASNATAPRCARCRRCWPRPASGATSTMPRIRHPVQGAFAGQ